MEAQGGSGGEVRRLQIIYFLCRKGRIEHPHLIRVHHLSRNGVRLRDVKRWLSELRGKDMPESFSWSYKRRYKTGYVWQDLVDDDLITPISDNEYVLKGSEISSSNGLSYGENNFPIQKQPEDEAEHHNPSPKETKECKPESAMAVAARMSCEINEESPPFGSETSTLTDDHSRKHEEQKNLNTSTTKGGKIFDSSNSSTFYSTLLNKKNKKKSNIKVGKKISTPASTRASKVLRNLINCRVVETCDSTKVMPTQRNKDSLNISDNEVYSKSAEIVKGEKLGGSDRIFGTPWNQQGLSGRKSWDGVKDATKKKKTEIQNEEIASPAYKPINGPSCSQCGKQFRPDKLQKHMTSCKGMKALAKVASPSTSAATAEKTQQTTLHSSYQESVSGYFLTNK